MIWTQIAFRAKPILRFRWNEKIPLRKRRAYLHSPLFWFLSLSSSPVRTHGFHPCNRGSNPRGDAKINPPSRRVFLWLNQIVLRRGAEVIRLVKLPSLFPIPAVVMAEHFKKLFVVWSKKLSQGGEFFDFSWFRFNHALMGERGGERFAG